MRKFFAIASLLSLTLSACTEEAPQSEPKGKGRVTINCVAVTEVDDTRANISCATPAAEEFALKIEGVSHTYSAEYASVAEFNADNYLNYGKYKATVVAGDITEEGYDKATFVGSQEFEVIVRAEVDVDVTATIANSLVKVEVTEAFERYFEGGYQLKLTTAGENEFDVTAQTEPIFIAPESFTISGTAIKQPNQSGAEGLAVTLPEYTNEEVEAQTLYTVKLDVEKAGGATLTISLNDTPVEKIEIEQELNDNAK